MIEEKVRELKQKLDIYDFGINFCLNRGLGANLMTRLNSNYLSLFLRYIRYRV
jgi:hypothetical protein